MSASDNLIPLNTRSKQKQIEIASKGGKASAIKRRQNKEFRKLFNTALESVIDEETAGDAITKLALDLGIDIDGMTYKEIAVYFSIYKAIKSGDLNDIKKLADILGEKLDAPDEEDKSIIVKIQGVDEGLSG